MLCAFRIRQTGLAFCRKGASVRFRIGSFVAVRRLALCHERHADRMAQMFASVRSRPAQLTPLEPDAESTDTAAISVRDEGAGLPAQFDLQSGRLEMRLIKSFAQQLDGNLQIVRKDPGTEFVLTFPLRR